MVPEIAHSEQAFGSLSQELSSPAPGSIVESFDLAYWCDGVFDKGRVAAISPSVMSAASLSVRV